MIKNSEEAIEKVLTGLRACDAPPEMEQRIFQAARSHASAQSQSSWRWLKPAWSVMPGSRIVPSPLLVGVALMALLAVAAVVPSLYRAQRAGKGEARLKPTSASVKSVAANSSPIRPPESPMRSLAREEKRTARLVHLADSLALRELCAASRPAPPLPLTKEEKMLLQMARTAGPEELAMLNPEVRAQREAEANEEFQQFFRPATAKQNEQN